MPKTLDRIAGFVGITTQGALLDSFATFARRAWKEIEPKEVVWSWHIQLECEYLQLCFERRITRLIVCQPPRSSKSRIISILFACWCWAKDPSLSFIFTSYSDSLSTEFSIARRALLQSDWFQSTFPGRVLFAPDQNMKTQYMNTAFGQMISTSMGGTIAGKGGDFIVIDDALSPEQSYSDPEREAANRSFDNTFRSRLNEPERGVIINVQQRLHQKDLCGHLEETEPGVWTKLVLPMVAEVDEDIVFPISGRVVKRRTGYLLQPERFGPAWIQREKRIGSYRWNSQYQQHPSPPGGAIFKTSWLKRYDLPPTKKDHVVISLDTAFSTKKTADFSVASVWIANEDGFFLVHLYRDKVEYPQLKMATQNLASFWKPTCVLVEAKGSGQSLCQSLQQETTLPVVGFQPDTDKISRAHGVTALFASGRIFLPKSAPWLADFESELEQFPYGAHDDQVDSLTMALHYLRDQMYSGEFGVLEFQNSPKWRPRATELYNQSLASELVSWVRNKFGDKVPSPGNDNVGAAHSFPIEARVRGLDPQTVNLRSPEMWKKSKPDPCRFCGSPSTVNLGLANHCNQCGKDDYPNGKTRVVFATRNGGFVERDWPPQRG